MSISRLFNSSVAFFVIAICIAPDGAIASESQKDYHSFCGGGKMGIFSESGKVLVEPKYERTDIRLEYGVIRVRDQGKVGTVDLRGNALLPIKFDLITPLTEGLRPVQLNGVAFYLDEKNRPANGAIGIFPSDYRHGFTVMQTADNREVLMDKAGKALFDVASFGGGFLRVESPSVAIYMENDKSGWIDLRTRKIYSVNAPFLVLENGVVVAHGQDRTFLLDLNGMETRSIEGFIAITVDKKILVQRGMDFQLLDLWPQEITDPAHITKIDGQRNAAYDFRYQGKHGLVNDKGRVILAPEYDSEISIWSDGVTMIRRDFRVGLVDDLGKIVVPPVYEGMEWRAEDRISFKTNGQWGFLDGDGKIVIAAQYEQVHRFDEGIAEVKKNGRWLKINSKGDFFLPLNYAQDLAFFENGLLSVRKLNGNCMDYFDRTGNALFKSVTDEDGTERFVDIRKNKTIWSSKE
ncbi:MULTISPECIES: WG repeat-containing protein [unclassified Herbaspirillum]|uniref:WG repeat-containing protein n=1 Tax=unclassified Herbaspirillum TaxID=2624150 RepID=UPI001313DE48|nr:MULTISPECIES: WG repeat-containing protein [unclassified Herbaspirillum]